MKKFRIIIRIILLIMSVAVVVRWVSGERMLPWQMTFTLHNPQLVADMGEHGLMVADMGNRRLTHFTSNGHVDQVMTNNGPMRYIDQLSAIYGTHDGTVYLAGSKLKEGGIYADAEYVISYHIPNHHSEIISSEHFGDSARVAHGQILILWTEGDTLHYLCRKPMLGMKSIIDEVVCLPTDEGYTCQEIHAAEWVGSMIRATRTPDGQLLLYDKYHINLWDSANGITLYDGPEPTFTPTPMPGTHSPLTWHIWVWNWLFMAAVAYLIVMMAVGIVSLCRRPKNRMTNGQSEQHHGRNMALLIVVALMVSGFYTLRMYQDYKESYIKQICCVREQMEFLGLQEYREVLEGIVAEGQHYFEDTAHYESARNLENLMRQLTHCPSLPRDVYADIFMIDSLGQGVNIADADEVYTFGEVMSTPEEVKHILSNANHGKPFEMWDYSGTYFASICPWEIGGYTFCIEAGCYMDDVKKASVGMVGKLFFRLLILFLILYAVVNLLSRLPKHWHSFRMSRTQGQTDAGVWLSGVLAFLFYAIMAIDQGVMVYLVYSLSEGCTPAQMALRASLPMMLYMGIGMTAYLIQPVLRKFLGDRMVNMGAAILAVCVFVMMGVGIIEGSFVVYCIGKALSGMLMGIVFNTMYSLPLIAQNDELRNEGLASITLSCLAANILFISVGGYLSEALGYEAVYFAAAMLAALVVVVAAVVFPKGKTNQADEQPAARAHAGAGETIRFLLSGKMISYYLGVLLPFGMMNAYCYYLYPIYAEQAGMEVSQLANMIVFGYALAYVFGEKLVAWKNGRRGLWVLVGVMMMMGILELAFAIAGNIWWATIVLMMCCVMIAIPRSEANVFIAEEGKKKGLDVHDTNSGFSFALDATEGMASPLMGWCVGMGLIVGTNLIGVISLALTSVFAVWQHRSEFSFSGKLKVESGKKS